jgi:hypothetical protein
MGMRSISMCSMAWPTRSSGACETLGWNRAAQSSWKTSTPRFTRSPIRSPLAAVVGSRNSRPLGLRAKPGLPRKAPARQAGFAGRHRRADRGHRDPHQFPDPDCWRDGGRPGVWRHSQPRLRSDSPECFTSGPERGSAGDRLHSGCVSRTALVTCCPLGWARARGLHAGSAVSNLIDAPNSFSLLVAALAGVVGVISLTEARSSTIIAVGISVTTIPTASDIGVSVAFGSWTEAWGSAVQLALNVSVLTAVATLGLPAQQALWQRAIRRSATAPPD